MKVKISYEYDPKFFNPYWAKANGVERGGKSWEEAKERLIDVLKQIYADASKPADEEAEI
jgi:hypothetical protein